MSLNGPPAASAIPPADVVTGAAGFIGSHLVDRLLSLGHRVIGIDDFDDYYDRPAKERNLEQARRHPAFSFREEDLFRSDLSKVLTPGCRLFHLAAQPGVRGSWGSEFDRYLRNNIALTQRLLEEAKRSRPSRIVYASSSSVYGAQPAGPMSETAVPFPLSPYGVTKLGAEQLGRLYFRAYQVPVVAVRFFTVYGPRQRPDMAFHRFIEAARAGKPLTLFGTGGQIRDFTYIDDIVDGIVAASEAEGAEGMVFNLGGGAPTPLRDAIAIIEKLSGAPFVMEPTPLGPGDPESTWADIRLAQERFGYRPKVRLDEGLRRQWDWHRTAGPSSASRVNPGGAPKPTATRRKGPERTAEAARKRDK